MRTFVHVGQHKTATTAIQHYLIAQRAQLEKAGLYVPDSLCGYANPSHFALNVYSLNEGRLSSMKEALLATKRTDYLASLGETIEKDLERHYREAVSRGCKDAVWSNEGLYLLNSEEEYQRLIELFRPYSTQVVCVCCFRAIEAYRKSYMKQHREQGLAHSEDPDSYRYFGSDSWLFDYDRKRRLLDSTFDESIYLAYDSGDMIGAFMRSIGYPVSGTESMRLNVTPSTGEERAGMLRSLGLKLKKFVYWKLMAWPNPLVQRTLRRAMLFLAKLEQRSSRTTGD